MDIAWLLLIGGVAVFFVLTALALAAKPLRQFFHSREATQAVRLFRIQREQLEAKFFDLASKRGKPRGLRWIECDWQDDVTFARELNTGLLTAFAAVNIRFEAIEGGDMEEVEAVSNIRDAAAVFHFEHGRWGTGGRALFNMNPRDAVERLATQFERVPVDTGAPARA